MKYLKILFFTAFYLLSLNLSAQVSGYGCNVGGQVAMEYLGTANYYGGSKIVDVYRASNYVPISEGQGYNGYNCLVLNMYPAGKRYNASTNSEESYKAEYDIISTGTDSRGCVVAASLNSTPQGEGPIVRYSYKKPEYCSSKPADNLPIDTSMALLCFGASFSGFFVLRKRLSAV